MTQTNEKPQVTYTCQECGKQWDDDYDARRLYCGACAAKHSRESWKSRKKKGKKKGRSSGTVADSGTSSASRFGL